MKQIYRNLIKGVFAAVVSVVSISCESIKDNMDYCGIYLEFVYDYNMEYADSFDPQVMAVDIFVFDDAGHYLFTRHAARNELIDGKRMLLGNNDLAPGHYTVLTVGGLSADFTLSAGNAGVLVPGQTSLEDVEIALVRQSATVSNEFAGLWVGKAMDIDNGADLSVHRIPLVKDTNHFNMVLTEYEKNESRSVAAPLGYTFEIVTPEGAVYGADNAPLAAGETVTYTPYYLAPGGEEAEKLSVGRLNTMRLFYDKSYDYKLIIRNILTGTEMWNYDLMALLTYLKPASRPDGSNLPMQEFLDRKSEWDIVLLYKEGEGGSEGFLAVAIQVNDWIIWLNEIGV